MLFRTTTNELMSSDRLPVVGSVAGDGIESSGSIRRPSHPLSTICPAYSSGHQLSSRLDSGDSRGPGTASSSPGLITPPLRAYLAIYIKSDGQQDKRLIQMDSYS